MRIKEKKTNFDETKIKKIVGMLIDENFTIDEIIELLKTESELDERLQEAEEIFIKDDQ